MLETDEGLCRAEEILTAHKQSPADDEAVAALFRVFHSIKGFAGALAISQAVKLAHATETLLNLVREHRRALDARIVDRVFEAASLMRAIVAEVQRAIETSTAIGERPEVDGVLKALEAELALAAEVAPTTAVPPVASTLERPSPTANAPRLRGTMKVDVERVDTLVEMIGELIVVESMVSHAPEVFASTSRAFRNNLSQLGKISRDLQGLAMRLRMVPVRWVFQKMNRMVHDVSRAVGKEVVLLKTGEETEMDRSIVEHIEEPLVHLIRNAIDHGIEPAAVRVASGKPAAATISMRAFHEGGHIVIEVADDGRGIQTEAVLRRARERGLISPDDALSESQIFQLIFAPGFSTAEQVSELSGRGVGMDVVKKNVEALRGRVSVNSQPGKGTTIRLVFPLTLAVIKGMLVSFGDERYIVPSLSIVESFKAKPSSLMTVGGNHQLVEVRGELLPVVRLDRLFGCMSGPAGLDDGLLVVVEAGERRLALWVQEVVTEQQIVIKPLGVESVKEAFFSGAAILADGRVGLILDVERIAQVVGRSNARVSNLVAQPGAVA